MPSLTIYPQGSARPARASRVPARRERGSVNPLIRGGLYRLRPERCGMSRRGEAHRRMPDRRGTRRLPGAGGANRTLPLRSAGQNDGYAREIVFHRGDSMGRLVSLTISSTRTSTHALDSQVTPASVRPRRSTAPNEAATRHVPGRSAHRGPPSPTTAAASPPATSPDSPLSP